MSIGLAAGLLYGGASLYLGSLRYAHPNLTVTFAVWMWAGITVLVVAAQTSRAIVQERAQGTWDALLLTRLRPREIVWGKLLGSLIPMWLLGIPLLPACLVAGARTPASSHLGYWLSLSPLAFGLATATIGALGLGSLGLYASMRCSSVWAAQLWTFIPLLTLSHLAAVAGLFFLPVLLIRFNKLDGLKREG